MRCKFCWKTTEDANIKRKSLKAFDEYDQLCRGCEIACDLSPQIQQLHKIAYLYNVETPKWRYWFD